MSIGVPAALPTLDLLLKKHGIHKLIVIGLIAHTCVEATVRYAAELGYEVTVVKDATADYSDQHMHAALDINLPNYASAIVTTDEMSIPFLHAKPYVSRHSTDQSIKQSQDVQSGLSNKNGSSNKSQEELWQR
jgi:hypothetical protein